MRCGAEVLEKGRVKGGFERDERVEFETRLEGRRRPAENSGGQPEFCSDLCVATGAGVRNESRIASSAQMREG